MLTATTISLIGGASITLLWVHTSLSSLLGCTVSPFSLTPVFHQFNMTSKWPSFRENCKLIFSLVGVVVCTDWESLLLSTVHVKPAVKLF